MKSHLWTHCLALCAALSSTSQFVVAEGENLGAACERQANEAGITGEEALVTFISDCVDASDTANAQAPASQLPRVEGRDGNPGQ